MKQIIMKKKWKKVIPLSNRYEYKVFLEHKENNIYYLKGGKDALHAVVVTGYPNNITAVDPSGGPYISIGTEIIEGYIVESIECNKEEGFKIKFKEQ